MGRKSSGPSIKVSFVSSRRSERNRARVSRKHDGAVRTHKERDRVLPDHRTRLPNVALLKASGHGTSCEGLGPSPSRKIGPDGSSDSSSRSMRQPPVRKTRPALRSAGATALISFSRRSRSRTQSSSSGLTPINHACTTAGESCSLSLRASWKAKHKRASAPRRSLPLRSNDRQRAQNSGAYETYHATGEFKANSVMRSFATNGSRSLAEKPRDLWCRTV